MTQQTEAQKHVVNVDALAQYIREVDGDNRLGAAALSEKICDWLNSQKPAQQPLTDDLLDLITHNLDPGDWNDLNFRNSWYIGFKAGFREAEKEYGIKEQS